MHFVQNLCSKKLCCKHFQIGFIKVLDFIKIVWMIGFIAIVFITKLRQGKKNTIANRLNKVQSLWSYGANL